jgi:hypothetical protein
MMLTSASQIIDSMGLKSVNKRNYFKHVNRISASDRNFIQAAILCKLTVQEMMIYLDSIVAVHFLDVYGNKCPTPNDFVSSIQANLIHLKVEVQDETRRVDFGRGIIRGR